MNAKDNIVLMAGGGAGLVLLLVGIGMLLASVGRLRKQEDMLGQQRQRLEQLSSRVPAITSENARILAVHVERLEFHVGEYAAELMQDSFPPRGVGAADFSARAQNIIERFRKRADRAGVELAESFEAGFEQYVSGGALPEEAHVDRLVRQLYSAERVASVLVRSGVAAIEEISRDRFDENEGGPSGPSRRRPRRSRPQVAEKENSADHLIHSTEGAPYAAERIDVIFSAKEDVVWRVLHRFSTASQVMVVREFAHETQSTISSYDPSAAERADDADAEATRFLEQGILRGSEARSRMERIVAGDDLIRVTLSVEVYHPSRSISGEVR